MMMLARDEATGVGMTDLELRDEVMTLMLAGHEVCYLSSKHYQTVINYHLTKCRLCPANMRHWPGVGPTLAQHRVVDS